MGLLSRWRERRRYEKEALEAENVRLQRLLEEVTQEAQGVFNRLANIGDILAAEDRRLEEQLRRAKAQYAANQQRRAAELAAARAGVEEARRRLRQWQGRR